MGCTDRSQQPAATCCPSADSGRQVLPFRCSVCNSREGRADSREVTGTPEVQGEKQQGQPEEPAGGG